MGDFVEQLALEELGSRRYRTVLRPEWMTWGPAGGYVAALALRAAGAATEFERPASFSCQFLRVARFDAVEIQVETMRAGRRTEALRATMRQAGEPIVEAQVWAVGANAGLEHDYTQAPDVPGFADLRDVRELQPEQRQLGIFQNLERRPIGWTGEADPPPRPPVTQAWFRFTPTPCAEDRFVDATRAVVLIDTFSWPATWPAHPAEQPSPWIAPNLDLHVRFHHDARPHDWLLGDSRAALAAEGLIGTTGSVWSPTGQLIAAGSSQLFCRPRPARFR